MIRRERRDSDMLGRVYGAGRVAVPVHGIRSLFLANPVEKVGSMQLRVSACEIGARTSGRNF
jgi:hypothetical protein